MGINSIKVFLLLYTFLDVHNINTCDMVFYLELGMMWLKRSSLHLQTNLFLDLDSQGEYTETSPVWEAAAGRCGGLVLEGGPFNIINICQSLTELWYLFFAGLCCNKNREDRWRFPEGRRSLGKLKLLGKLEVDLSGRGGISPTMRRESTQTHFLSMRTWTLRLLTRLSLLRRFWEREHWQWNCRWVTSQFKDVTD